jgi:hypothetical protein
MGCILELLCMPFFWVKGRYRDWLEILILWIFMAIFCLIALIYLGARFYIVLDSLISLRHVPMGLYETPSLNIMGFIPHL